MILTDVHINKVCPADCGCIEIEGGLSPTSWMWTHENVEVIVRSEFERVCTQSGKLYDADPDDEYVDLLLPCGTLIGYVDVRELENDAICVPSK